jgi:hypothetical protein
VDRLVEAIGGQLTTKTVPVWFQRMPNYTLKKIPDDLLALAQSSAASNFRSLNQELIHRVQLSFDLEEAAATKLHTAWIQEALESGPGKPATEARWRAALSRGIARAKSRK